MTKKTQEPIKLDLGCGRGKEAGHIGVDRIKFPSVDVVCDLGKQRWPWKDGTVESMHCSHMLEHLKPKERIHFANEAFRCLKPGGRLTIVTPHWSTARAYGDLTHEWPPVAESWFFHLNKKWREESAPHLADAYTCDFINPPTWSYSTNPTIQGRSQEWWQFATNHYKEAIADMIATITKP